jgi:ribosomal protein S18 acetylase RimI-like enzyme
MTDSPDCELLEWDTDFFGFRIARVLGDRLGKARARAIERWCFGNKVRCLYFEARADDQETVRTASSFGYDLVDHPVILTRPLDHESAGEVEGTRTAVKDDLPALTAIARASFSTSRYYFDPRFTSEQCDRLYAEWVRASVRGWADRVIAAIDTRGEAVGFVTCHLDPSKDEGRIGLIGVAEKSRGTGQGRRLVGAALRWMLEQGASMATVRTQARNTAAVRAYEHSGFRVRGFSLFYHRWF